MQEHLVNPYSYLPCTGHIRARSTTRPPIRTRSTTGIRSSTSRWTCRRRSRIRATRTSTNSATCSTSSRRTARAAAAELGVDLRLRADHAAPTSGRRRRGSCRRSAGGSACTRGRPIRRLAGRPALEAGRLDPARDRPEGPARDAAPDGALLRADRERRQARHAARADGRREPEQDGRADRRAARAAEDRRRRRRDPGRPAGPLGGDAPRFGTSYGVFGNFPVPIAGKTGTAREGRHASRATPACRTSRGGAATVRPTTRRSSSAP